MNAHPSQVSDGERALRNAARMVAEASQGDRMMALADAVEDVEHYVRAGRILADDATNRLLEIARSHDLCATPDQDREVQAICGIAESGHDPLRSLPKKAVESLESMKRTLAAADHQHRAMIFTRGAGETLRLFSREKQPGEWQRVIDEIYSIGEAQNFADGALQTLMEVATYLPPDRRPERILAALPEKEPQSDAPPVDDPDAFRAQSNEPPPARLSLVTPPDWRDVPLEPMRWLATHRIPAREPTILGGDGGLGKTTLALQLGVSVAADLGDWLGTTTEAGPVIFFSAEEPMNEMRRRLERVARKCGLDPAGIENLHFHFADPESSLLGISTPAGPIVATPRFHELFASAIDIRPSLVIVDSVAAVFGGNQNDRVQVRTFVSLFRRLAREADCAVLLLDHPSLSGMTSGTGRAGSMDWSNAVRARLHMRSIENGDGGERELEVMKSNYGPTGDKVALRWEDGCFVLSGTASAPRQAAANTSADQRYLECLDAVTGQGRHVCHAPGRGYAPKTFAAMPQAGGLAWRAFQQAQERLFASGTIENISYGPKSKGTKCIARKA